MKFIRALWQFVSYLFWPQINHRKNNNDYGSTSSPTVTKTKTFLLDKNIGLCPEKPSLIGS